MKNPCHCLQWLFVGAFVLTLGVLAWFLTAPSSQVVQGEAVVKPLTASPQNAAPSVKANKRGAAAAPQFTPVVSIPQGVVQFTQLSTKVLRTFEEKETLDQLLNNGELIEESRTTLLQLAHESSHKASEERMVIISYISEAAKFAHGTLQQEAIGACLDFVDTPVVYKSETHQGNVMGDKVELLSTLLRVAPERVKTLLSEASEHQKKEMDFIVNYAKHNLPYSHF